MTDRRDYVALDWVKGDIDETLKQARYALEAFVETPEDINRLEFSLSYIHQVYGTLQMVEFYGAALLAEEMEQLNRSIVEGLIPASSENLAVLMQAIIQLPNYLDQLKKDQHDIPVVVLPLLNDLRAARGASLLSETALFSPELSAAKRMVGEPDYRAFSQPQTIQLIKKLRQMFQLALLGWLKDQDIDNSVSFLVKATGRIAALTERTKIGTLWRIADAYIAAIKGGYIARSPATAKLLRDLDSDLKNLIAEPVKAVQNYPSETLLKNLLFYIAKVGETGIERVTQVQRQYDLVDFLPSEQEVESQRARLSGPDKGAVSNVVSALLEELASLKESLDLMVRTGEKDPDQLGELLHPMKQLCDTMAVVGLGNPHRVLSEQVVNITDAMSSDTQIDDNQLMDIAGALVYVEATLKGVSSNEVDFNTVTNTPAQNDLNSAHEAVLREARNGLEQIREGVVDFIGSHFDSDRLVDTVPQLKTIRGGLSIIPLMEAAAILKGVQDFIEKRLIVDRYQPQWDELDTLADALVGVEYYLERIFRDGVDTNIELLERAAKAVDELGFNVGFEFDSSVEEASTQQPSTVDENAAAELPVAELIENEFDETIAIDQSVFELNTESEQADAVDDDLIDDDILEIFIEEVDDVLAVIREYLPQYKDGQTNIAALSEFRRAFHTLKGSGRMVGANIIGETAWAIENMLNALIDGRISVSEDLIKVVEAVTAEVPLLVKAFENKYEADATNADALAVIAHAIANGEEADWNLLVAASSGDVAIEYEANSFDGELDSIGSNDNDVSINPSDENLLRVFQAELDSHLEFIESYLADDPADKKLPDALQRALHTIKGSAHMASVEVVADIVMPLEALVKEMQERGDKAADIFLTLLESMTSLVREFAQQNSNAEATVGVLDFINKVQDYRRELSLVEHANDIEDVSLMTIFLSESMDIVMDAEHLLEQWANTGDAGNTMSTLIRELDTLAQAALSVDLMPVSQLSNELRSLYQAADANPYIIEEKFFSLAHDGHESLISMMDRLAAGQSIRTDALFSERLKQLFELYAIPFEVKEPESNLVQIPEQPLALEDNLATQPDGPESDFVREKIEGDPELVDIFIDEANDILERLQESLDTWVSDTGNTIEVESLQRDLHTLKGGARMAEISALGDLAHELEFLYEGIGQGKFQVSDALLSLLQECHNRLETMIGDIESSMTCLAAPDLIAAITYYRHNPNGADPQLAPNATQNLTGQVVESQVNRDLTETDKPAYIRSVESEDVTIEKSLNPGVDYAEPTSEINDNIELPDDLDFDILEIFIDEASELLAELENASDQWQADTKNEAYADELKRILHTLKGGARLAKLSDMGDQSHDFENYIVKAQQNKQPLDEQFFSELLSKQDSLVAYVEHLQSVLSSQGNTGGGFGPSVVQLVQDLDDSEQANIDPLSNQDTNKKKFELDELSTPPADNVLAFKKKDVEIDGQQSDPASSKRGQPQETVKVNADLLEGLVNLAGETSITRARLEQEVSDFTFSLGDMDSTIDRLRDQVRRLDLETEAQVNFRQERAEETNYEDFDPLEMDRYSQIQQLSRSLMEATYDLQDIKVTLSDKTRDAETILLQQSRINTELQEGLMQTRMVPFNRLLPRLRRIVRQVSAELGKQVDFVIGNAEGEVDRTVLERMISPLEHMLRNAVDHGIEMPDVREGAGKPSKGTVALDLAREGSDIVLRMQDDGKGIDVNRVREKAIENGLIATDTDLNDNEIMQFILDAGFSTAEQVTQISGRGVGMDVVNSEVKQLGGSMSINSQLGDGTEFVIRLPFTVSVNRALMVNALDDLYALPLTSIEGIVRVTPKQLAQYYQPDAPLFEYGGSRYRLEYMASLFHTGVQPNLEMLDRSVPLILVRGSDDRHSMALHVDQLMGSREIVVKNLGPQFNKVPGVSGATILGDGSVVVILDLPALIRSELVIEDQSKSQPLAVANNNAQPVRKKDGPAKILVCDDSVTVRKVTSRLLQRNGMDVMLAKHGGDAITQMMDDVPDLILLDIEMPHMDGFEVAQRIRHDSRLKHIPIIMITSRTGNKHRERAISIGVNEYMGKPFQEGVLLETISSLLAES